MTKVDWKMMGKGAVDWEDRNLRPWRTEPAGLGGGRRVRLIKSPVRSGWSGGREVMGEIYRIQSSMVRTGA